MFLTRRAVQSATADLLVNQIDVIKSICEPREACSVWYAIITGSS